MTDILLDINIEDKRWNEALTNISILMEKVKTAVFEYVKTNMKLKILNIKKPFFIGICLSDDRQVQHLNKEFRNLDKPTNVLSFANIDDPDFLEESKYYPEFDLGSIIIAYETMNREAEEQDISLEAHFCHLLTHGFLHLLGFDHIKAEDAQQMEKMETDILASLEIDNPYEEI